MYVNAPLLLQIHLVAGDGQADVGAQHLPELLDPVLDLAEAVLVRDVVDQDGAVGVAVVDWAQRVEALLSRRVPDGKVNPLPPEIQLLVQEGGLTRKMQCENIFL